MFKIYALYHKEKLIYVGKTERTLKQRLDSHFKSSSTCQMVREYMDEHGRNKSEYRMEQLDTCSLEYPEVAEDIERSYVQWLKPTCNATPDGDGHRFQKGDPNNPMKDPAVGAKVSASQKGVPRPYIQGEKHGQYRHDLREKADQIVELHRTMSYSAIGRMFNASPTTIKKVIEEAKKNN